MKVYKQPLSKLQKFKKSLRNVQEFIEININWSYSLYHTYLDMKKELVIIPFHSPKQRHENVIEIIPLSELRTIDIENMKILSLPNGILSTNSTPFEIVYQRKNPKFSPIYQVWKNNQNFGKIFNIQRIKVVSNFDEFREKLYSFSFDPSNTAIITSDQIKKIENYKKFKIYSFIPKKIENLEFGKPNINSIKFFENTDTVEFEANGSQPSFIVVNNRYHTDWKAYLNEQKIPVLKTNGIVQSLIIPPGIHRIKLKFEPPYKKIVFLPIILMFIYTTLLIYFTIYKKH
ncbi:MAG: hypothetical protein N2169_02355 [bacterium]|nr:hypothetical protein [bacterium]